MNVLLVGPRGSGKTTVGRAVSAAAGLAFVDLDGRVLARFPETSVTEVWSVRGEAAWREGEVAAIQDVLAGSGQLVALGGGAPMIDAVHRRIEEERRRGRAVVIYLKCAPEALRARLAAGPGDRPGLTGDDPVAEIGRVLRDREPRYEAMADLVYEPGDEDLPATIDQVARLVARRCG